MLIGLWPTIGVKPKRGSFEDWGAFRSNRDHLARDGAAEVLLPSIHRPHSDVPSLQIVMQPIGKPSGKVHASQPILARKPRYPTEKARTGRFSRIEDIRDPGFLSEGSPQTLGNPLDRGTSRGIPRFLCPILPFDVYLFREARRARPAFAASAPRDSRYSEREESARRSAHGANTAAHASQAPRFARCESSGRRRPVAAQHEKGPPCSNSA